MATPALALPFVGQFVVTQPYGPTKNQGEYPGHGYNGQNGYLWHNGIDYALPTGTPVLAAGSGTVLAAHVADGSAAAYYFSGFGNMVIIDHGGGVWSLYGHNQSFNVSAGAGVQQGQQIALSDSTGNSSGPHLHFSVFTGNGQTDVDPSPYLTGSPAAFPGTVSGVASYAQVIYWARQAGFPDAQLATAAAIAMAESSLRLAATHHNGPTQGAPNGSNDNGLWQINDVYWPQYDPATLRSDGQYNAVAAKAVYDAQGWHGWSTYHLNAQGQEVGDGAGTFRAYLADAQAALNGLPPGAVPASTNPSADPYGTAATAYYQNAPVDNTPQLPAQQVRITPVAVSASDLLTPGYANPQAVAVLWIAGYEMPVLDLSVTVPTYLTPGQWSATLDLRQLDLYDGLWDELEKRSHTQMIAFMGYVKDKRQPFTTDVLSQMFTGLVVTPHIGHKDRQMTLGGPDLSGIFSSDSATLSSIPDSWMNAYVGGVVQQIVARHNPKGGGLSADVQSAPVWAGQAAGSDFTGSRQQGVTEWDWLTQMASTLGYLCYMDGTTLRFRQWPADAMSAAPLVLDYAVDGEPATLVDDVQIDYMTHAKRDYQIVTQAFQTKGATTIASDPQGNPDIAQATVINLPANTPKDTLNARAKSIYQLYQATEVKVTVSVGGVLRVAQGQPIALRSSRINQRFLNDATTGAPRRYFPASITYTYRQNAGLSMSITATNRPAGTQQSNTSLVGLGV